MSVLVSIAVLLMVVLVTAFWAYQGLFSSVIMFVETVVACIIAFTYYEELNDLWVGSIPPGIGLPLALMGLFLALLLGLRTLTDKFIPGEVRMPLYVNRAVGGVYGFFTGMILIGTALIGIQMLPIGSSVFGFERFMTDDEGHVEEHNFMLSPDRFTAGMVSMLSDGRFGGDNPFFRAKPDLVLDLYSGRAAPQSEARVFLPPKALQVKNYWETRQIDSVRQSLDGNALVRQFETREPIEVGNKFIVCYVNVDASATPERSSEIRFRLPQFRIVGPRPDAEGKSSVAPRVFLACGMSDLYTHRVHGPKLLTPQQPTRLVRFGPQTNFILGLPQTSPFAKLVKRGEAEVCETWKFDVAFEVPEDFVPWYVEFKRGARADLTDNLKLSELPAWGSRALGSGGGNATSVARQAGHEEPMVGKPPGGRTNVANAIEDRTGATDLLPVILDRNEPLVARNAIGERLRGGDNCHFFVDVPQAEVPADRQVNAFQVPADKRMIQIGASVLKAESMYGRALNFASRVAAQITIRDSNGQAYYAIGQYAAAQVEGKQVFEIQYYPDAEVPERCLQKPKRVTHQVLTSGGRDKTKFGYLFLVDPGVNIVSFHAGRTGSQALNIQAPA
jgi:hypothetical protein